METDLAAERQAHAGTKARLEAGRAELEAAGRHLAELRTQFSTELERARAQVAIAQERAEASERRALRELDQERTACQKSERVAEELHTELAQARSVARDAAVAQAEVGARLEAQAVAADRLAAAEQAQRKSASEVETVQSELAAAQRRAEWAEAEATLARQLLAELRVAPRERDGGGRRRKAGGPAPTAEEDPGAPTASLNPDDGNHSNDGNPGADGRRF